jgi:2-amino-4-hydroxy-6-hydroxymethyldihydropteridine diphosphokinase
MVILGLGSNQGDRLAYLSAAVAQLRGLLSGMRLSRVVESEALLCPQSPAEWDMPFLNMAVSGETALAPQALLAELKAIERRLGRMDRGTWAPREIDIDILAMDDVVLAQDALTIPHPGLLQRDFALLPLIDVAPGWTYPDGVYKGQSAADIAAARQYSYNAGLIDKGRMVHG